jgi:hypothetical protein
MIVYNTQNYWGCGISKYLMETDPVSETLSFLVFRILDDRQNPETQ